MSKNKMNYETPKMDVLLFAVDDIIRTSGFAGDEEDLEDE